jgi:hypothetical protein
VTKRYAVGIQTRKYNCGCSDLSIATNARLTALPSNGTIKAAIVVDSRISLDLFISANFKSLQANALSQNKAQTVESLKLIEVFGMDQLLELSMQ